MKGNPECDPVRTRHPHVRDRMTRFTLDLSAIPVLKEESHLPVFVDPSHSSGHWRYVAPMALAAIAAGADGLLVEVHPRPAEALCDGPQALKPDTFQAMMDSLKKLLRRPGAKPKQRYDCLL